MKQLSQRPHQSRRIPSSRNGLGMVEVVVCVGCLLLILAIAIPWMLSARDVQRKVTCEARAKAIAEAIITYSDDRGEKLPYLVEGEAGWPVGISPFLDLPGAVRDGAVIPKEELEALSVPQFVCPDDPRSANATGLLSYIVNGGYGLFPVDADTGAVSETGTHSAEIDLDGDGKVSDEEWAINYATGVVWRPDTRKGEAGFRMSLPYISSNDGTEFTLLLSENLNAEHWLSDRTMDLAFVIGRERLQFADQPDRLGPLQITSTDLGPFAVNGNLGKLPGQCPAPSSLHGDFVNVMYCDGHGGPLSAKIDPRAYAALMTS
ncbi:MAG: DUF1559 domain-containing protein, partial [Planctomycetaceae bacterium]|nr:DUF1559 domain-containing protein [Planctomycetaceae bacterium]